MAKNLTREQRHLAEQKAWMLRVQGFTVRGIADKLAHSEAEGGIGIALSPSTVHGALRRQEKALLAGFMAETAQIRVQHTYQLEYVQQEAMLAWERSQLPAERVRVKRAAAKTDEAEGGATGNAEGADLPIVEMTHDSRTQAGDPRFLAAAMDAMRDIRSIWGLNAPSRVDLSSGGQQLPVIGYVIVPPAGAEMPAED